MFEAGQMEALGIWDPLGWSLLASTDIDDASVRHTYGSVDSVHGPMQALFYTGFSSPHVPENSGDDSFNIDVIRRAQPQDQTSHSCHVINYAPLDTLLTSRVPITLSSDRDGIRLQSLPTNSIQQDGARDISLPCSSKSNDLRIVAWSPRTKSKGEPGHRHAYRKNALVRDKNPRSHIKRDASGSMQGAFQVFGANERIRSHSHTAMARAVGACGRCRGQKVKCIISKNIFVPCAKCAALPHSFLKTPCIRVDILKLDLHRRGSTLDDRLEKWTLGQNEFPLTQTGFEELQVLDVVVTQDQGIEIPVKIRRFNPRPGDTTSWKWSDSAMREKVMEMPPFYICNYDEAARNMIGAVEAGKAEYVDCLLGAANPILRKTVEAAFRYLEVSTSSLVSDCLTFWVATRFIEKPWRICHGILPDFEPPYEPQCPYSGIIPVTPIMDTQIDDMAIRKLLGPLGKKILRQLSHKIHEKKRENWFDIYLATFIIMNNFEFVFADVLDYTNRHGLKPSSTGAKSLSKSYFHACKTLLVYFRFACNGTGPFSLKWNEKSSNLSSRSSPVEGLTFDQQEYLRDIKDEINRQRNAVEGWRSGSVYSTSLYLCYQMLAEDWSADIPHSGPIDDFTEEDFLTS